MNSFRVFSAAAESTDWSRIKHRGQAKNAKEAKEIDTDFSIYCNWQLSPLTRPSPMDLLPRINVSNPGHLHTEVWGKTLQSTSPLTTASSWQTSQKSVTPLTRMYSPNISCHHHRAQLSERQHQHLFHHSHFPNLGLASPIRRTSWKTQRIYVLCSEGSPC